MKLVEKFISINGEGPRAGEPAVFIRFKGCNLRCSYCDTRWACEEDCPYEEQSPSEIYEYIRSTGITNVTITGGEPLLQPEMLELLSILVKKDSTGSGKNICSDGDNRVEIETNGSIDLKPFTGEHRPVFTMDYKLPLSGCEDMMLPSNFELLYPTDTVKFVCAGEEDLDRAAELIRQYSLTEKCFVYFSPVFEKIKPSDIVDFMIRHRLNDVRLQLQMHKIIWHPQQRGV